MYKYPESPIGSNLILEREVKIVSNLNGTLIPWLWDRSFKQGTSESLFLVGRPDGDKCVLRTGYFRKGIIRYVELIKVR